MGVGKWLLVVLLAGIIAGSLAMETMIPLLGLPLAVALAGGLWATLAATFGVLLVIAVATTVLPTLSALRLPEPKVIARLLAE